MIFLKKAAVSLAAMSIALSPVVASAAPVPSATSAISVTDGQNEIEGSNWLPILLALAIIAGGIWLVADGDDDPVSP